MSVKTDIALIAEYITDLNLNENAIGSREENGTLIRQLKEQVRELNTENLLSSEQVLINLSTTGFSHGEGIPVILDFTFKYHPQGPSIEIGSLVAKYDLKGSGIHYNGDNFPPFDQICDDLGEQRKISAAQKVASYTPDRAGKGQRLT